MATFSFRKLKGCPRLRDPHSFFLFLQVFGLSEYLRYQEALSELATAVKARSGSSERQHQSAAKDLTQSPEVSPTTIQVTYLPSSQKSKRAKHFLELKSFKDNYNTLESTLWRSWRPLTVEGATQTAVCLPGGLTQVIWVSPALDQLKPWLCSELLKISCLEDHSSTLSSSQFQNIS